MPGDISNYFIRSDYQSNTSIETADQHSGGAYWTGRRIRASYIYQHPVYSYADALIKKSNMLSVVDIGCGVATKLAMLKNKNPNIKITGIDQESAIEYCLANYDFGHWLVDDLETPTLTKHIKEAPDLIICSDVIEHLMNPNTLINYILSLAGPSTKIIISTPARELLRDKNCLISPNPYHIREWSSEEFLLYLAHSGLTVIDRKIQLPIKPSLNNFLYPEIIKRLLSGKPIKYNHVILAQKTNLSYD